MDKPTAVIDESLLRPICAWEDGSRLRFLRFLMEHFTIWATPVLMEETAANYYRQGSGMTRDQAVKMLDAIASFSWMEHPLELVYQEAVLKRDLTAGFALDEVSTRLYRDWMAGLDRQLPELEPMFEARYERKHETTAKKQAFQKPFKERSSPEVLTAPDHAAFVRNAELFLHSLLLSSQSRTFLAAVMCKRLDRWHQESAGQTRSVLSELDRTSIATTPFTHDYLLAHILYLSAPVAWIGSLETLKSNPLVLPGKQVNNDEDEEYVTSAVLCDYLFTCDEGMRTMASLLDSACLFKHNGTKKRQAVLLPRAEVDRADVVLLEARLRPLA